MRARTWHSASGASAQCAQVATCLIAEGAGASHQDQRGPASMRPLRRAFLAIDRFVQGVQDVWHVMWVSLRPLRSRIRGDVNDAERGFYAPGSVGS